MTIPFGTRDGGRMTSQSECVLVNSSEVITKFCVLLSNRRMYPWKVENEKNDLFPRLHPRKRTGHQRLKKIHAVMMDAAKESNDHGANLHKNLVSPTFHSNASACFRVTGSASPSLLIPKTTIAPPMRSIGGGGAGIPCGTDLVGATGTETAAGTGGIICCATGGGGIILLPPFANA